MCLRKTNIFRRFHSYISVVFVIWVYFVIIFFLPFLESGIDEWSKLEARILPVSMVLAMISTDVVWATKWRYGNEICLFFSGIHTNCPPFYWNWVFVLSTVCFSFSCFIFFLDVESNFATGLRMDCFWKVLSFPFDGTPSLHSKRVLSLGCVSFIYRFIDLSFCTQYC